MQTPTGTILLTFRTPNLPETIQIVYERARVKEYIPTPMRCRNCNQIGHTTKLCNNPYTCAKYGSKDHRPNDNCINSCINCKKVFPGNENHSADSRECPTYKKKKKS